MKRNSSGSGSQSRPDDFYFDKLPPRLRLALAGAAFDYSSKWFYDKWNSGKSVDWCIAEIKQADRLRAVKMIKWRKGFNWLKAAPCLKETKVKPLYCPEYFKEKAL